MGGNPIYDLGLVFCTQIFPGGVRLRASPLEFTRQSMRAGKPLCSIRAADVVSRPAFTDGLPLSIRFVRPRRLLFDEARVTDGSQFVVG